MKKQILLFTLFTIALMLWGTIAKSQDINYLDIATVNCPPVTSLGTCAQDTELNPIPGKTYTYTIGVTPAVTTNGRVRWYVYNASQHGGNIIVNGSMQDAIDNAEVDGGTSQYLLDAEDGIYNDEDNTSASIDISWQAFDGATTHILLIAYVDGELCADNIEVWRIEPSFSFTLDLASVNPDGALNNGEECVTPVQIATYNVASTTMTMDYGENYIFFAVTAANFVHSWMPTFAVTSTGTPVAVTDISWATPDQAIISTPGTWNAATEPVPARNPSGAVGSAGECIIVRVHVDHNTVENDADFVVTLTVDGIMYDAAETGTDKYSNTDLADLDPNPATGPCLVGSYDKEDYTITGRPNITPANPTDPFVPKNP